MYSSYDGGSDPLSGDSTDPSLVTRSSCHLCVIRTMSNVSGDSGSAWSAMTTSYGGGSSLIVDLLQITRQYIYIY